jgi:hypothetical protein
MALTDLDSVISQEVLPDELKIITFCEESQNFSVIVEELFLRWYSSTTEFLLKELKKFWVLLWWDWFA